jgi:hypothetical protein
MTTRPTSQSSALLYDSKARQEGRAGVASLGIRRGRRRPKR